MASTHSEYLETLIEDIGGQGVFQWIMIVIVLGSKIVVSWSTLMMTFGGAVPEWRCQWTDLNGVEYSTGPHWKTCELHNTSVPVKCASKYFDPNMNTVVSEWDLTCDRDWISSTITTIQMGGLFLGGFISGQIADYFGRKFTYFMGIFILFVFNTAAAFSNSWEMFAVFRFFIGTGCGFYLTIYFTYLIEFTPRSFRSLVVAIPIWSVFVCVYALVCWWLHDWSHVQIAIAVSAAPFIFGLWFVPESYRWLVSNGRIDEAYDVVLKIAKMNNKPPPDRKQFEAMAVENIEALSKEKKYTLIDLLKHRKYLKYALLLSVGWISCGYGYYAISFGIEQLSGDLYLNLVLINVMDIVGVAVWYFANCIGRKWTSLALFVIGSAFGVVVGIVQFIDLPGKGDIVTGFALVSKVCVGTGWSALMLLTSELYPTVVRNIGYGLNNALARLGAMVAPQLVFASEKVPGLSYLSFAGLMFISAVLLLGLPETNKTALNDTMDLSIKVPDDKDRRPKEEYEPLT